MSKSQIKDVALATGSACTSTSVEPSHVIRALGFGDERAHSALQISVGRFNTEKQIGVVVDKLLTALQNLFTI